MAIIQKIKKISTFATFFCLISASMALAFEKPISVQISGLGGYDNNTGLNAEGKGDVFVQETATVLYQRLLHKKSQLQLSYSILNNNYFEATDQNVLAHNAVASLNLLLATQTVLENSYSFSYLGFLRSNSVTSYASEVRMGLRQRIGSRWIVKGGWSVSGRDYVEGKLTQADGLLSLEEERRDLRHTLDFLVKFKWKKDVILSAGTGGYWNDSNDFFHDYYDAKAYKLITGASWEINPKLQAYVKFIYENRMYDSRPLVDFSQIFQKDDLYTTNASLFYKLGPDLSLGNIYTYRQKNSNEPSQKYSGFTNTLGLYYSF